METNEKHLFLISDWVFTTCSDNYDNDQAHEIEMSCIN